MLDKIIVSWILFFYLHKLYMVTLSIPLLEREREKLLFPPFSASPIHPSFDYKMNGFEY